MDFRHAGRLSIGDRTVVIANAVLARAGFRQATEIGTDCRIGNGAFVSSNCRISRSLIGHGAVIAGNAASARTPPSGRVRWRSTALRLIETGRSAARLRANRSAQFLSTATISSTDAPRREFLPGVGMGVVAHEQRRHGAKGVERGQAHRQVLEMADIGTPRHGLPASLRGDATIPQLRADLAAAPRRQRAGVSGPLQAPGRDRA